MKTDSTSEGRQSSRQSQQQIRDEINRMSKESDKKASGKQGKLFDDEDLGEEDIGFEQDLLEDVANPDLSHNLYYGMWKFMKDKLPKGKENEQGRRFIYDEVNLFLNRGKHPDARGRRGSDSRMAYINPQLQPAFSTVIDWLKHGAIPYHLYEAFRQRNESLGYHDQKDKVVDVDYEEDASSATHVSVLQTPSLPSPE